MAKVYIANRPVRFDKNYNIWEIIPAEVIDPKMARKLIDMGRITYTDIPNVNTSTAEDIEGTNNQVNIEDVSERQAEVLQDGTEKIISDKDTDVPATEEFTCKVCGKVFKSQNALAAHSRSHKN